MSFLSLFMITYTILLCYYERQHSGIKITGSRLSFSFSISSFKEFWLEQYHYYPKHHISSRRIYLNDAINQGLILSNDTATELKYSKSNLIKINSLLSNYRSVWNGCDHRLFELLEKLFLPFEEIGGIYRPHIEQAIYPFDDPSISIGQFVIQVIDNVIWLDYSQAYELEWYEWHRVIFVLESLVEWIEIMKTYQRPINNFEFVLETKDCPFMRANSKVSEDDISKAWDLRSSLPIMSIIKCKNTNTIPLVQWWYQRDGLLEYWDLKWWNLLTNCNKTHWKNKLDKAIFRGAFSPYSSFDQEGKSIPTAINSKNWNSTGRSFLHLLGLNNTDTLDINVLDYGLYPNIFKGSMFENVTAQNDKKLFLLDQIDNYRYILSVEGWCGWADRLKYLLHAGAVIMKQETNCGEYYEFFIKPWEHYIPIATNYRDLVEKVEWARKNQKKVKEIAKNGQKLAQELLNIEGIKCYQFMIFEKYSSLFRYKPKRRHYAVKWTRDSMGDIDEDIRKRKNTK